MVLQRRTVTALTALALLAAGCGGPSEEEPETVRSLLEVRNANWDLVLQIDAAVRRLEAICLDEAGVGTPEGYASQTLDAESAGVTSLLWRFSIAEAEEHGYLDRFADMLGQDMFDTGSQLSDEQTEQLYGPDAAAALAGSTVDDEPLPDLATLEVDGVTYEWFTAGCAGRVADALYGDDREEFVTLQHFATLGPPESIHADGRVVEAFLGWTACVADAGYEWEHPSDAMNDVMELRFEYADQSQSWLRIDDELYDRFVDDQRAIAVADATCREQTAFDDIVQEIWTEYVSENIVSYEVEIHTFHEEASEILARAQDLIQTGRLP